MKYMIHCCNKRWWYVNDYLLPSLLDQGINAEDIIIYRDMYNEGNLTSCINSFLTLPEDGGTWHLQDDVIVASNFKKRTEELDAGLVCGFCCEYDVNRKNNGVVSVVDMWYSFPCIRIPNNIALEFVEWFNKGKEFNFELKHMANRNKNDDLLFKYFLERYHMSANVILVNPNLVDHVDYLIGGSTVNQQRDKIIRSLYWEESELVDSLKNSLINR